MTHNDNQNGHRHHRHSASSASQGNPTTYGTASASHSRQNSLDDFLTSGAFVDHRTKQDLAHERTAPGRTRKRASHSQKHRDSNGLNELNGTNLNTTASRRGSTQPILPLTNQNLQNLYYAGRTEPKMRRNTHYGSVALDMDKYAQEQSSLMENRAFSNPFNVLDRDANLSRYDDEQDNDDRNNDDDDGQYSMNSYEFGGSNPSSEHSSDSTSLDDVCFHDYYDHNGNHNRDSYHWPDLKVLEEFVREELEEVLEESYEEEQVKFNLDFERKNSGTHRSDNVAQSPTAKSPHEVDDVKTPLLNNRHVNEVESLSSLQESFRVRPTPIQPWEKSREEIPTILVDQKGQSQHHKKGPRSDGKLCRFTYFRDDLPTTIHSPTISGLISESTGRNDAEGTPDPEDEEDIMHKLEKLFQVTPPPFSKSPSSISIPNMVASPPPQIDHSASSVNLNVQPLTKIIKSSKGTESPKPDPPSQSGAPGSVVTPAVTPPATPYWLDVLDPTEEEMKVLSKTFGIHPLTTEDIFLGEAREKVELFKSYYFICFTSFDIIYERRKQRAKEQEKKLNKLQEMYEASGGNFDGKSDNDSIFGSPERKKSLWGFFSGLLRQKSTDGRKFNTPTKESVSVKSKQKKIREGELSPLNMYMIVFKDAVITFHFSATPHPINVRRRARLLKDYLTVTSDWICYALVDDITDSFAPMIDSIEEEVNSIEDAILKMHSGDSDSDDSDDSDDDSESEASLRPPLKGRKRSNENHKANSENVFFRRKRTKSTVDHGARGNRIQGLANKARSMTSKSSSKKSSRSSKGTASKIIGWKRKGDMLRRIGECRKRVMSVLRLLGSKADVIKGFSKRFSESIHEHRNNVSKSEIGMYLSDIQDHIVTMIQSLNHYEKLLARFHSNYLAQINIDMTKVNNDTNDVLGKITILGTIVLPINVVTGLWGMNCVVPGQDYPGLAWFWCIVASMIIFSTIGYNYAKRVTGL